jgi:hypothetical protein
VDGAGSRFGGQGGASVVPLCCCRCAVLQWCSCAVAVVLGCCCGGPGCLVGANEFASCHQAKRRDSAVFGGMKNKFDIFVCTLSKFYSFQFFCLNFCKRLHPATNFQADSSRLLFLSLAIVHIWFYFSYLPISISGTFLFFFHFCQELRKQ